MTSSAPRIPKIAPDAPTVTAVGVDDQRAGGARKPRDEVEREVAKVTEVALDRRAEPAEREHVQADVEEVPWRNAAVISRHQSPLRDRRAEQQPT